MKYWVARDLNISQFSSNFLNNPFEDRKEIEKTSFPLRFAGNLTVPHSLGLEFQ